MEKQQANEHEFNMRSAAYFFCWKMAGLIGGVVLALGTLIMGAWLLTHGASASGIAVILVAIAGLVGTVIYGHKANNPPAKGKESSEVAIPEKTPS